MYKYDDLRIIARTNEGDVFDQNFGDTLVFFHIPKTAGTTVSTIMKGVFREQMWEAKSQYALNASPSEISRHRMISGHFRKEYIFATFPKRDILTIIRDPVKRAISQYNNWRDDKRVEWASEAWDIDQEAQHAIRAAQTLSLTDFIATDSRVIAENTRNIYCRAFCDGEEVDPYTDDKALVENAFENLRQFLWIGLVERLDESMLLLARQLLQPAFLYGARQIHNRTTRESRISSDEKRLLREINSLDYALMPLIQAEFGNRLQAVLRDGVAAATRGMRRRLWTQYDRWVLCDYESLDFLRGWSFEETTGDGRSYRWSFGDAKAEILFSVSDARAEAIDLQVNLMNIAPDLTEENIHFALEGHPPVQQIWTRHDHGWQADLVFDLSEPIGPLPSLIVIALHPSGERVASGDPRDHLGVALANLRYRLRG